MAYLSLPGSNGAIVSSPDDADFDLTGDHKIRFRIRKADWTPSAGELVIGKWGSSGNWSWHWQLEVNTGKPMFNWTNNGSTGAAETGGTVSPAMTENVWLWMEFGLVASTRTVTMKTHADQVAEPTTGWTTVSTSPGGASTGTLYNGTADFTIGSQEDGSYRPTAADIRQVVLRGTSDTLLFTLDPDNWTSGTTWVTNSGHTMTLEGTATIVSEATGPTPDPILGTSSIAEGR